jgi:tRNA(Ile)-lysidine synthase
MLPSRALFTRFHEFCRRRRLIAPRGKIVVAVSGGIDSVALLDLLAAERNAMQLQLAVAHCNHGLRGEESDGDEKFVADLAARYGCEVLVERTDTALRARAQGKGIQETARDQRYEFFARVCAALGFDAVATAHNADDNAETVILHMMRGTGLRGWAGIPMEREGGVIIRPLLFAGRDAIEEYAVEQHLAFRADSSNAGDHYTRNIIRHHILPRVKESVNPSVTDTLLRQAELLRDLNAYLERTARQTIGVAASWLPGDDCALEVARILVLPVLLRQYVVLQLVEDLTGSRPDWTLVEGVLDLLDRSTGSWIALPGGWLALRDRERILLRPGGGELDFSAEVEVGREYDFGSFRFSAELAASKGPWASQPGLVEYVDADQVGGMRLVLRTWREGDWFVPLGMEGRKKISDFLIDARVPLFEKKRFPVLQAVSGDVIWLCGHRLDDRFKLTGRTRRVLRLAFIPTASEKDHAPDPHGQR